jgi:serine/threonine protein kinase
MLERTQTYRPDDRFLEAVAAFEEARDAAGNPNPTEWLQRYPDIAGRLREFFADERKLRGLASPVRPAIATWKPPAIPDFEILNEISAGGMGIVYKANKKSTGQTVALKLIRPGLLAKLNPDERRRFIERFVTEGKIAAQLEHENLVKVYDVGTIDGQPYYAMRYVEGTSLSALIKAGALPAPRAAAYLEQVARAVHHAHQRAVIHRDLKPNNILIDARTDKPLVADFGLAKLADRTQELTRTGDVMGAPPYMSPEQARSSAEVTAATDVYGLGATLYAALTGQPPFQGDTPLETLIKVLEESPPSPGKLNPSVPRDLETICMKCLEKEPSRRYASAEELAGRLRLFLENRPIPDRPISATEWLWRWCRRNPVQGAMSAALPALLLVMAVLLLVILIGAPIALYLFGDLRSQLTKSEAEVKQLVADLKESQGDLKKWQADLKRLEADLKKSEADLKKSEADLKKSEADLKKSEADLKKSEANVKKLELEAELNKLETDLEKSETALEKSEANLKKSEADLKKSEADLKKLGK